MLKYFLVIIFTCVHYTLMAQVNFLNPSFEDTISGPGLVPNHWNNCNNNSPDLHPITGLTNVLSNNGNNHIGLAALTNFLEIIGQEVNDTFYYDSSYCFSVDLARMPPRLSGTQNGQISIWISDSLCGNGQLIFTSPYLDTLWQTFTVDFKAQNTYNFFLIKSEFAGTSGYVYIDNLSDHGCADTTTAVRVVENEGEGEISTAYTLTAFPNPTSNFITIQWDLPEVKEISIYNALGQLIVSKSITKEQYQLEMELGSFAPGIYHVTVSSTDQELHTNITVSK